MPSNVQFDNRDKYMIRNYKTHKDVETQPNEINAVRACNILNDHEERNGRPRAYHFVRNPKFSP